MAIIEISLNKADLVVSAILLGFIGGLVGQYQEIGTFIPVVVGALFGIIMCIVLEIIKERVDGTLTKNNNRKK